MKTYILNSLVLLLFVLTTILQIQSVESSYSADTPVQEVVKNHQDINQFSYLIDKYPHLLPNTPYTIFIPHNSYLPHFQNMNTQEEQDFLQTHIVPYTLTYEELKDTDNILTAHGKVLSQEDLHLEEGIVFYVDTQRALIHEINTTLY